MKTELVIARYNEDVSWTTVIDNPDIVCTIYNKGQPIHLRNIQLPNIGRESHTYLHHIIQNYNNLADITVFCQGDSVFHSPKFMELIYSSDQFEPVQPLAAYYWPEGEPPFMLSNPPQCVLNKTRDLWIKDYPIHVEYVDNEFRTRWPHTYYQSHYIQLVNEMKEIYKTDNLLKTFIEEFRLKNVNITELMPISYAGLFAVRRDVIHQHPKSFYERIMDTLINKKMNYKDGRAIDFGLFLEKMWLVIFNYKINNKHYRKLLQSNYHLRDMDLVSYKNQINFEIYSACHQIFLDVVIDKMTIEMQFSRGGVKIRNKQKHKYVDMRMDKYFNKLQVFKDETTVNIKIKLVNNSLVVHINGIYFCTAKLDKAVKQLKLGKLSYLSDDNLVKDMFLNINTIKKTKHLNKNIKSNFSKKKNKTHQHGGGFGDVNINELTIGTNDMPQSENNIHNNYISNGNNRFTVGDINNNNRNYNNNRNSNQQYNNRNSNQQYNNRNNNQQYNNRNSNQQYNNRNNNQQYNNRNNNQQYNNRNNKKYDENENNFTSITPITLINEPQTNNIIVSSIHNQTEYAYAIIHFGSGISYIELELYFILQLRSYTNYDIIYLYSINDTPLEFINAISPYVTKVIGYEDVIKSNDMYNDNVEQYLSQKYTAFRTCNYVHGYSLTEYKKVCIIESDLILMKSIDSIFELNTPSTLFYDIENKDINKNVLVKEDDSILACNSYSTGNGGIMLVEPNLDKYKEAIDSVKIIITKKCKYPNEALFQYIEQEYYNLPIMYNLSHYGIKNLSNYNLSISDILIFHFNETQYKHLDIIKENWNGLKTLNEKTVPIMHFKENVYDKYKNEVETIIKSISNKYVALLFLTNNDIDHKEEYEEYINQCNVYIHPKDKDKTKYNEKYREYIISEHVETSWGDTSIVEAMVKLLAAAYENVNNKYFILLSQDSCPIYSVGKLFKFLNMECDLSIFSDVNEIHRNINMSVNGNEKNGYLYKSSQWWCLKRDDVFTILKNWNNGFKFNYKKNSNHYKYVNKLNVNGAPDEYYLITLLKQCIPGYKHKELKFMYTEWVNEITMKLHPTLFNKLTYYDSNKIKNSGSMFIRKVTPSFNRNTCLTSNTLFIIIIGDHTNQEELEVFIKKNKEICNRIDIIILSMIDYPKINKTIKEVSIKIIKLYWKDINAYIGIFTKTYGTLYKNIYFSSESLLFSELPFSKLLTNLNIPNDLMIGKVKISSMYIKPANNHKFGDAPNILCNPTNDICIDCTSFNTLNDCNQFNYTYSYLYDKTHDSNPEARKDEIYKLLIYPDIQTQLPVQINSAIKPIQYINIYGCECSMIDDINYKLNLNWEQFNIKLKPKTKLINNTPYLWDIPLHFYEKKDINNLLNEAVPFVYICEPYTRIINICNMNVRVINTKYGGDLNKWLVNVLHTSINATKTLNNKFQTGVIYPFTYYIRGIVNKENILTNEDEFERFLEKNNIKIPLLKDCNLSFEKFKINDINENNKKLIYKLFEIDYNNNNLSLNKQNVKKEFNLGNFIDKNIQLHKKIKTKNNKKSINQTKKILKKNI